jgi:hypothetical protein
MPYNKPNNKPTYVNTKSNHPPTILNNIPLSVNKRLSDISSDFDSFNDAAPLYQRALTQSGYQHTLTYAPSTTPNNRALRNRTRNIVWYNPPYSKNVSTNIGLKFLKLIDEEFATDKSVLHKIFNRNNVKVSYCCMPNVKQILDGHNKATLKKEINKTQPSSTTCNCRNRNECPLDGQCLKQSIIYQATVTASNSTTPQTYIGLTENTFKTRYTNHKASFNNYSKRSATELSKYIWDLKGKNITHNITWKVVRHANSYNINSKRCNLCLWEKYYIIYEPKLGSLNKRNELISACRHASKYLLRNFVT